MKKSLRFAALAGALALSWAGATSRANAYDPYWCGTMDGTPCQSTVRAKCNATGGSGVCTCSTTTHTWHCIY